MQTTVYFQLSFDVIGDNAGSAARSMLEAISDGKVDLPIMQVMEDEFSTIPGDWRIVGVDSSAATVKNEVTP